MFDILNPDWSFGDISRVSEKNKKYDQNNFCSENSHKYFKFIDYLIDYNNIGLFSLKKIVYNAKFKKSRKSILELHLKTMVSFVSERRKDFDWLFQQRYYPDCVSIF